MSIFKQVQDKFWQNEFVLQLQPEERYFYMYLITNTMTTLCGIYRFNLKLAELETGLTCEVIERHLKNFEIHGKIIISKTSKEIMIVNWFKHNFKSNKRTIASINKELREVKDKGFLNQLYEICERRQYPSGEIFNGIIIDSFKKDAATNNGQSLKENPQSQERAEEKAAHVEMGEAQKLLFTGFKETPKTKRTKKRKGKIKDEEIECNEMTIEDDVEEIFEGTTIASWGFAEANSA